jgi:uncharacterized membrane protein YgcG
MIKSVCTIASALALLVAALLPAVAQERILSFVSDVRVERNGDLFVTETIRVQAEGRDIRRGILRDFPTVYSRRDGMRVEVGFVVQSVTRDGAAESYGTERLQNGVRVRIGNADTLLTAGPHTYVISYRTTRQLGFFPSFDELYWNATGNGWTFAIDVAEARITLPENVPFRQSAFYTGPQGATGKDATVVEQAPGRIVFRTTRPLPPRNGLTVAAAWQKGVIAEPGASRRMAWWIWDNLPFVAAGVGLALLLAYYAFAWVKVGRDPRRGTVIPLFAAPKGMSAAAVRYVYRMAFDNRTFAAAILDLAVRRHLTFSDSGSVTRLDRKEGGGPLPSPERAMEAKLFGAKATLSLENTNHARVSSARAALQDGLAQAYRGLLFQPNTLWSVGGLAGWLVVMAAIAASLLLAGHAEYPEGFLVGMALAAIATALGTRFLLSGWRRDMKLPLLVISMLVAIGLAAAGLSIMHASVQSPLEVLPGLVPFGTAPLVVVAFPWLKAPTAEGRAIMDQIEGLKLYLGTAEEERLEYLTPPEKTPELFERFLPYAVALDVENTWAARFADVLAAAAIEAVAPWYLSDEDWRRDPGSFVDRLGSQLSETVAAASTAPGSSDGSGGSSGSSGGGSSGGGGGGGGGSGW